MALIRFLFSFLILAMVTEAEAGDLAGAGMLSGLGQGLGNAASQMSSQMMQYEMMRGLQRERFEMEQAREAALAARGQQFEQARQTFALQVFQAEARLLQMEHRMLEEQRRWLDVQGALVGTPLPNAALEESQAATPLGQTLQVSDDDLAKLRAGFPELAKMPAAGLHRVLSKLKGTGAAMDKGKDQSLVSAHTEEVRQELAIAVMDALEESWRTTVKSPEYLAWLAAQPQPYRDKIHASWRPGEVLQSIAKFKHDAQRQAHEQALTHYRRWLADYGQHVEDYNKRVIQAGFQLSPPQQSVQGNPTQDAQRAAREALEEERLRKWREGDPVR